jgi:hypothetical protein
MSWFKSILGQSPPAPPPAAPAPRSPGHYPPAPPAWAPPDAPKAASPPAEIACSFCGTPRKDANKLVAGPNDVAICDACVAACSDVLVHGDNGDSLKCAMNLVIRELAGLSLPVDFVASRKLVSAALLLAGGSGLACRQIAATAAHLGDHASAALAFGAITPQEATTTDRINEAISYETAGAPRAGLALLDTVDPARCSVDQRILLPLHRLSIRLAAGLADRAEAETADPLGDEIDRTLPDLKLAEAYQRDLRREILLVRARAARLLGDRDRAIKLLRGHLQGATSDTTAWAVLYEVHADGNHYDDALAAKTKALALAHPDGPLAAQLRSRTP